MTSRRLQAFTSSRQLFAAIAGLILLASGVALAGDEFYEIRTNKTDFAYIDLGTHVPARSARKPFPLARFVAAPDIGLPMQIDPKAGEHMYCNSQVYNLGGFFTPKGDKFPKVGLNHTDNYYFPWTSNFCEKRDRNGDTVCGTPNQEHMGQDCRPPTPTGSPKWWVIAVDDGIAEYAGASHSIAVANDRFRWLYLHMANRQVQPGQRVKKGQRLGQVWNVMQGGTSIHLHIELKYKDRGQYRQLDPLPSLIAAYQRALGNPVAIEADGTLGYDPRFEVRAVEGPPPVVSLCGGAESKPSIGTETQFKFTTLWCHNGSLMGLVEEGEARKLVYFKPRNDDLGAAVKNDPVLVEATVSGTQWTGKARHYSARCGNRQFDIAGAAAADGKRLDVTGKRDSFTGATCDAVTKVTEDLAFTFVGAHQPPSDPGPVSVTDPKPAGPPTPAVAPGPAPR